MAKRWNVQAVSASLSFMFAGCVSLDAAIVRTADLEQIPAPDCVQRVIETAARPAATIQRRHIDWTHEITGRMTHSVDVFTFRLDDAASPPVTISISENKNVAPLAMGSGWNYRFYWDYDRASAPRLTEVGILARRIEREISIQCAVAPFSDKVRDSGGTYRNVPPLV